MIQATTTLTRAGRQEVKQINRLRTDGGFFPTKFPTSASCGREIRAARNFVESLVLLATSCSRAAITGEPPFPKSRRLTPTPGVPPQIAGWDP